MDFKDTHLKHKTQQYILQYERGHNVVIVALSTLALRLLDFVYKDCNYRPKIILVESVAFCARHLVNKGVNRLLYFDIFEPGSNEKTKIASEVSSLFGHIEYEIASAIEVIDETNKEINPGTRVYLFNQLSELLAANYCLPYTEFPLLSYKVTRADDVDVLSTISKVFDEETKPSLYTTEVYGARILSVLLYSRTDQTYKIIRMWYDDNNSMLYVVPSAPVVMPNDKNYLCSIFKQTYNNVVWDHILSSLNMNLSSVYTMDERATLCTLANYLYSFERFLDFWQSVSTKLDRTISLGKLEIQTGNLYALCGSEEIVADIVTELKQAYGMNFRLKPLTSLAEHEQNAQLLFDKINKLDDSDDATSQRVRIAVDRASDAEEVLEVCYTASGVPMGYSIASLMRALGRIITVQDNPDVLRCFIHQWLDEQLIVGSIQTSTVLQLEYWRNAFCTGYNEFVFPQQLARIVLSAFRRSQAILHRSDIPQGLLSGVITLAFAHNDIKSIGNRVITRNGRNLFGQSFFGVKNLIDYLVNIDIFQRREGNNLVVSEGWIDSNYMKYIGMDEVKANNFIRNVAEYLHPLSNIPLTMYYYILNIHFLPMENLSGLLQKVTDLHKKVLFSLESIEIDETGNVKSKTQLNAFIRETWQTIKDYLILWNLVERLLQNNSFRSALGDRIDLFIKVQIPVQLINFDIKIVQYLLIMCNTKFALELAVSSRDNLTINGKQIFPLDTLCHKLESCNNNYCYETVSDSIVALSKLNREVYE